MGGADFRPVWGEQIVANITLALRHLRATTNPGTVLWMYLSWAQAYAGISSPLYENLGARCPPVPEAWVMGVRKGLATINGKVVLKNNLAWRMIGTSWTKW